VIVLVLGGTRSGKSEIAERIAARRGGPVTFVATGVGTDDAMRERIALHRERRPASWRTVEAGPADLAGVLGNTAGTVVLDSIGTLVANTPQFALDPAALCDALAARGGHTVVVGEEVGLAVHPPTDAGVRFVDAVGDANRAVAAIADEVVLVVAGRALRLHDAGVAVDELTGSRTRDA
jgi:adenosylcobinamide kinase/adenosylcobinamide-phosphate guanylyltransferase